MVGGVTLRRRLTAALLAVVIGPLLLGAVAVGVTATRLADERAVERLNSGTAVVNSAVSAVCQRAVAAAEALAAALASGEPPVTASRFVVSRGLAEAAQVENSAGSLLATAGSLPNAVSGQWGDCAHGRAPTAGTAVAAAVDVHRADGSRAGRVRAALLITAKDLRYLAGVAGVGATALVGGVPTASVLPVGLAAAVATAVASRADRVEVNGVRLRLRLLAPAPGRPIETVLTTPAPDSTWLYGALALVVAGAAGAALVAANLLAKTLTRPLQEVAVAAQLVADGDLATRLPVRAYDEVGRLAATFNRMTRSTESYVAALTAGRDQLRGTLALLGDTMSSTNDVDRILEVILESLVATTAAEAGIVLLVDLDEPTGPLVGRRGLGMVARGVRPESVWLEIGEGLLGSVGARAEARCGRAGSALMLSPREPDCRTFLVAPIVGPPHPPAVPAGRLLGVLALYDRLGGDDFDDGDLVTVRSFAGHAAVAVENALLHRTAPPAPGFSAGWGQRPTASMQRSAGRNSTATDTLRIPSYATAALAKESDPPPKAKEALKALTDDHPTVGRVEVGQSTRTVTERSSGG